MKKALVTGGAGFIGSNLVARLLSDNWKVYLFDNLSRKGTKHNLEWIRKKGNNSNLIIAIEDVRDEKQVSKYVRKADVIFHLAAQVAVTSSVDNPKEDFDINAGGTLNVLEAARLSKQKPQVIFASTNKVYGALDYAKYKAGKTRYICLSYLNGINEEVSLDLHSPYACSKGTADNYVKDYGRIYGLNTVVFRQSCIYGPRQFGIVDQGWMGYIAALAVKGKQVTFFGDGKQVRDALYVDDLINAFLMATKSPKQISGEVFNIGGGVDNTFSLGEYINYLQDKLKKKVSVIKKSWRPGDQKVFISDNTKLNNTLGWKPKISVDDGSGRLLEWIEANINLF